MGCLGAWSFTCWYRLRSEQQAVLCPVNCGINCKKSLGSTISFVTMSNVSDANNDMDSVLYTIRILQRHNMDLVDKSTKVGTRSSTAMDQLDKLETYTNNCLMIAKLKTLYRRLHMSHVLKIKAFEAARLSKEAEDDRQFSEACDAIEPKWPVCDVDLSHVM